VGHEDKGELKCDKRPRWGCVRDSFCVASGGGLGARCTVVKWDSRSERDWRIFLNSEVALTVLVEGVSILAISRWVRRISRK
jgi:hypothetical protein